MAEFRLQAKALCIAVACSGVAFVARRALDPVLGSALAYAFALGGVGLSLYLAGWKTTWINVATSALWVNYVYFLPNRATFAGLDISLVSALASYLAVSAMLVYFGRRAELAVAEHERTVETLRSADKLKDEFISIMSHELRNPLGAISNAVLVVGELATTPELRRSAGLLSRQVDQMRRLLNDLLDVSRINRGLVKLDRRVEDVRDRVRDALEANAHVVEAASQSLFVDMPDNPVHAFIDGSRITQIVSNLVENAAKYAGRGARIDVKLRNSGAAVIVVVQDNGRGFPPRDAGRLFDRFRSNRGGSSSGLGLGLWISRSLAEMHGGTLAGTSEGEGKGATFTLLMPAVPSTERQAAPAPHTARIANSCAKAR